MVNEERIVDDRVDVHGRDFMRLGCQASDEGVAHCWKIGRSLAGKTADSRAGDSGMHSFEKGSRDSAG